MKIFKGKKIAIVAMFIAMGAIVMLPAGAFYAQEGGQGEKVTATREFTYKEGEDPDIPESISQFGQTLTLASVSAPVRNTASTQTHTYTSRVPVTYTPDQLAQAPPNADLTPVYGEGKRQVDRAETIRDLPDNDVERLQKRKIYADTDGRGPGAAGNGELALAEVKYEVTGLDTDGLPNKYSAHVVYRGEEAYTVLLYYTAEETFTREASEGGVATYTVVATYEGYAPADAPGPEGGPGAGTGIDGGNDGTGSGAGGGGDGTGTGTGGVAGDGTGAGAGGGTGADGGTGGGTGADASTDTGNDAGTHAGMDGAYEAGSVEYVPVDAEPAVDALYIEGSDELTAIVDTGVSSGTPSLMTSLAGLPPVGVAALATVVAAVLTLVTIGAYNRRKARDEQ